MRVSSIREGLPYEVPPRMLQRRLALLVEQQRLIAEGQRKGRRYRVPVTLTGKGGSVAGSAARPFRPRYRVLVAEVVAAVVRAGIDKKATTAMARQRAAEQVSQADQARFVEVVETELMSLHEGNIARYRLRPTEYQAWRQGWR
ncbi:MAG: hypothetical protein OXK76_17295 [Gammaproteobacteria bacterium]|nr:hypothetical protein [Gammaproteobacteria bacterium]